MFELRGGDCIPRDFRTAGRFFQLVLGRETLSLSGKEKAAGGGEKMVAWSEGFVDRGLQPRKRTNSGILGGKE